MYNLHSHGLYILHIDLRRAKRIIFNIAIRNAKDQSDALSSVWSVGVGESSMVVMGGLQ